MNWFRGALGLPQLGTPAGGGGGGDIITKRRNAMEKDPLDVHLKSLERTHQLELMALQNDHEECSEHVNEAQNKMETATTKEVARKHQLERNLHRQKLAEITESMQTTQGKLANVQAQLKALTTANTNIDQAIAVEKTAAVLKETVEATETIQLEQAVDEIKDSVRTIDDHNKLLTEPIFGKPKERQKQRTEDELELERLMNRSKLDLPSVPVSQQSANLQKEDLKN